MYIIVIKREGIPMPKKSFLKDCFKNNPHGAGFMTIENEKVSIYKGFETFKDFYTKVEQFNKKTLKALPVIFHFRYATHGGICKELTHPFPVTKKEKELNKLHIKTDVGVCHNGWVNFLKTDTKNSDTKVMVKTILAHEIIYPYLKTEQVRVTLEKVLPRNRLAFLFSDGAIKIIGDWIAHNDLLLSGERFKKF